MTAAFPAPKSDPAAARPRAISSFLLVVAGLVFAMVVVGGITRLTESGLSITEWNLVSGALPPLTQAEWQHEFDLYRQTPQFIEVAGPSGMTLAGFKFIFFWEWVHRLLGRILGLVFFAGTAWFAVRREIPKGYAWRLAALFVLGRTALPPGQPTYTAFYAIAGAVGGTWLRLASSAHCFCCCLRPSASAGTMGLRRSSSRSCAARLEASAYLG